MVRGTHIPINFCLGSMPLASASYGTGSDLQRAIQAATAITQGLTGGNIGQALAGGSAPYLAHEISKYLPADQNQTANLMAHAVLGAVVGHFSGNATVGAVSAFTAEAAAPAIIKAMGWDKDSLTEKQKQTVSALATLAAGLAGGLVGDSSSSAVAGAQAGKNAVENNSLSGDQSRESLKQSAEWWKAQVRDKLGENLASQLVNGLINAGSEAGDAVMLGGDTAFDLTAALAACATGDSYCDQAQSDLAKKDSGAAAILTAIINGDAWEGIKSTTIKAANGDQRALENVAGVLSGALVSAKVLASGGNGLTIDQAMAKGIIPSRPAESAFSGARLNMQLTAEQAAGAKAPTKITSYSQHALEQIAGRDGGIGISPIALDSAWSNPLKIEYVPSKYGPTFRYTGNDAVIVINAEGKVVTGWAKSSYGVAK
ncbi:adhesin [Yersinia frederiksenii]|nr:adhesin [Yersinia frederiksenii]